MAHLLTDELWGQIAPLLPRHPSRPRGGRRPVDDDRVALAGILFVLKTAASAGPTCRARSAAAA